MNNGKQIFASAPKFDICIINHFDKSLKWRIAAKTLRRDYKLCDMLEEIQAFEVCITFGILTFDLS